MRSHVLTIDRPGCGLLSTITAIVLMTAGSTRADQTDGVRAIRLPPTPFAYSRPDLPEPIRQALARWDNTPDDNPITDHGATLGRVLFYDRSLSENGTTSCASCHHQQYGFSEPKPTSIGFRGGRVTRNSMSLVNLRYYRRNRFFWDERAEGLERQVLIPIENPIEMGGNLDDVMERLRHDPIYPPLFQNAFGDPDINRDRLAKALAQFLRSIVSFDSRYDQGLLQTGSVSEPFPNFSDQENLGKQVFLGRGRCAECHLPGYDAPDSNALIFQLVAPLNNGIEVDGPDVDPGVEGYSNRPEDRGTFKTSSLRNLELTGPYMHDGRFHTIDQVIEHYNWSVQPHRNLDPRLEDFSANGLALPEVPKVALQKFLMTLTGSTITEDPRFSDPFVRPSDSSK